MKNSSGVLKLPPHHSRWSNALCEDQPISCLVSYDVRKKKIHFFIDSYNKQNTYYIDIKYWNKKIPQHNWGIEIV